MRADRAPTHYPELEICPSCGEFVEILWNETGWCPRCSINHKSYVLKSRVDAYLLANADEIEYYLLQGVSLNKAIDLLHRADGRPHCLSCGSLITRARRNAVFCRRNPTCRRYSRRYVYLYERRGLTKAEALAKVLEELT